MAVAFVKAHAVVSEKTLDTSASVTVDSGGIAAGNLIVLRIVFDNAGTASKPTIAAASSITKMSGETNNWVFLGAARSTSTSIGAFASGEMWAIQTTVAWSAGTYTVTLDTSVTQKAACLFEFSGVEATLRSTTGTNYSTTTTAASATTTGTTPVIGDLALGFLFGSNVAAAQAGDTDTTGGSWSTPVGVGSTGGSGATNNFGIGQYKILTAASHQTYNNSAAMTAGNGSIVAILRASIEPLVTQAAYRFYADGPESPVTLADSYSETNRDTGFGIRTTQDSGYAQSFLGDGRYLARAGFHLSRPLLAAVGNGTITAALYAHTGTFGSGGVPTGTALATSVSISTASVDSTTPAWFEFEFDGTYQLSNGTPYFVALTSTNSVTNALAFSADASAPTHAGNVARLTGGSWTALTLDGMFRVYTSAVSDIAGDGALANQDTAPTVDTSSGDANLQLRVRLQETNGGVVPATDDWQLQWEKNTSGTWTDVTGSVTTVVPYASALLDNTAPSTNRLTGGTGTFVAGDVTEDGVANDQGWSANNYTEHLYSITLKQADLTAADTLRFRVLRNGATTSMTYTQVPTVTIGSAGPTTWNVDANLPVTVTFGAAIAKTSEVGASLAVTSSFAAGAARTQPVAAANLQVGVSLGGGLDRTQPVAAPLAVSVAGTAAVDRTATVAFTAPVTVTLAAAAVQAGAVNIAFALPVTATTSGALDRIAGIAVTLPVTVTGLAATTRTQFAAANTLTVTATGLAAADRMAAIAATVPVTVTGLAAAERTQFVTTNTLTVTVGLAAAAVQAGALTAAFTLPVTVTTGGAAALTAVVAAPLAVSVSVTGALLRTVGVAAPLTVTVTGPAAADRTAGIAFTLPVTVTGAGAVTRTQLAATNTLTVTATGLAATTRTQFATTNTLTVTATGLAAVGRAQAVPVNTLTVTVGLAAVASKTGALEAAFALSVTMTGVAAADRVAAVTFTRSVTVTGLAAADRMAAIAFTRSVTVTTSGAVLRTVGVTFTLPVTVTGLAAASPTGATAFTLPVTATTSGAVLRTVGVTFTLPVTVTGLATVARTVQIGFTTPVLFNATGGFVTSIAFTRTTTITLSAGGTRTQPLATTLTVAATIVAGAAREQPAGSTLALTAVLLAGAAREQPLAFTRTITFTGTGAAARVREIDFALTILFSATATLPTIVRDIDISAGVVTAWSAALVMAWGAGVTDERPYSSGAVSERYTRMVPDEREAVTV